ncbi:MAG: hypothetical protein ACMG6E_05270 [Candidatus Roizmanbacteria bacterium]
MKTLTLFSKHISITMGIAIFVLLSVNMYLFSQTVVISDKIAKMEDRIVLLHSQNRDLNRNLQELHSLEHVQEYAPVLGLTSSATSLKLENNGYAMR